MRREGRLAGNHSVLVDLALKSLAVNVIQPAKVIKTTMRKALTKPYHYLNVTSFALVSRDGIEQRHPDDSPGAKLEFMRAENRNDNGPVHDFIVPL